MKIFDGLRRKGTPPVDSLEQDTNDWRAESEASTQEIVDFKKFGVLHGDGKNNSTPFEFSPQSRILESLIPLCVKQSKRDNGPIFFKWYRNFGQEDLLSKLFLRPLTFSVKISGDNVTIEGLEPDAENWLKQEIRDFIEDNKSRR